MGQITYADKSAINENPGVADTNKVKATDMNEIKTAVNDNDTNISGIKGTLLWTNPSPTSSFASQSISLSESLENYNFYEIIYKQGNDTNRCLSSGKIPVGYGTILNYSVNTIRYRTTQESLTGSSITFSDGSVGGNTNNTTCIPLYVIGYKIGVIS